MSKPLILPIQTDYNKRVRLCGEDYLCFSKKKFKRIRGESYTLIGETKKHNDTSWFAKFASDDSKLRISDYKSNYRLFYREAGYVLTGPDEYVVLLKFNLLLVLLILILVLGVIGFSLWGKKPGAEAEHPTDPKDVIPVTDDNQEAIPDETPTEKNEASTGGGSVDIAWSNRAQLVKGTDKIVMMVQNPSSSTHSCKFSLYLKTVEGADDILLAESGAVSPGYQLTEMTLTGDIGDLAAGTYAAYYGINFYDDNMIVNEVQSELQDIMFVVLDN